MKKKKLWIVACAAETAYGIVSMYAAVLLNNLATSIGRIGTVGALLRVGLPVIFFAVAYGGCRAIADSLTQLYADRAAQEDRLALSRAVFSMDSADFAGKDTGEYLNMATADVLLIRDQYYAKAPLVFCYVAQFLFCVVYSLMLNPVVGVVLMALSAAQYSVPALYAKHLDRRMVQQSQETARFTSKWKELLLGFSVIKSYGAERNAQAEFAQADEHMTQARVRAAALTQVMMCSNLVVGWSMIVAPVVLTGYFVMTGAMAAGSILTVFYIANRYSMPAMDFSAAWASIKSSRGMREKLAAFLQAHPERAEAESRSIQKGVEVRDLRFSYDGDTEAIRQISFRFEMGKKYLLLGESGCGKSTLLKLLAGQFPAKGIYIDGTPAETLPSGALRGKMILVGQQPYVFRRTVADNIDFVGTGDRKQILAAAEQCCMTEFLAALPQGIDTLVDEEQRQLSGGQKARIGLARALYTRPDVLLLDEVTSALDSETAFRIEQMLLALEDVMIIHVAHKPSKELMERYDAVLTMEDGRIKEAALK